MGDGVQLGIFLFANADFFFIFRRGTVNWLPSIVVMVSSWQMLRGGLSYQPQTFEIHTFRCSVGKPRLEMLLLGSRTSLLYVW